MKLNTKDAETFMRLVVVYGHTVLTFYRRPGLHCGTEQYLM
jgi:hypothetical protein